MKVPTDMVKLGSLAPKQNTREAEGVMKDQLITVMEALRVSRAELRTHNARRVKNAPRTIQRLKEILFDDRVTHALSALGHGDDEAPSVVPPQDGDARNEPVKPE